MQSNNLTCICMLIMSHLYMHVLQSYKKYSESTVEVDYLTQLTGKIVARRGMGQTAISFTSPTDKCAPVKRL